MERKILSVLIVTALVIGAGIGYYVSTIGSLKTTTLTATLTMNNTKIETIVRNYTVTTTLPYLNRSSSINSSVGVDVMQCAKTEYKIIYGNTTVSTSPILYNVTTSLSQTVGFVTTTTNSDLPINGTVEAWAITACTVVSYSG